MGEVRPRAEPAGAVLGAVARALGLNKARVTAEAGEGLRGDAAGALDEVDNAKVVLAGEGVEVVALDAVDAAEAGEVGAERGLTRLRPYLVRS